MNRSKTAGLKLEGARMSAFCMNMPVEIKQQLDVCQALINASNPRGGTLSKVDTVNVAIQLLYQKLKGAHAGVKKAVREVKDKAGMVHKDGGDLAHAETRLASDGEPAIDLNALVDEGGAAEANQRKARGR